MSVTSITRDELAVWCRYVHETTGVFLDDSKAYLLETRLSGLLRETGAAGFAELFARVKADLTHSLRRKIIDAITTNETSFFRDSAPFDLLRHKLIPDLIDRRRRNGVRPVPIRIWSAACSTGQEAYSVAIVLKELLGDLKNWDVRIVGTDISDRAVAQASLGAFSEHELSRGLPAPMLSRYFNPVSDRWRIRDELRAIVSFRTMNLLQPFSFSVPFDIVFCRNVAIYFTEADRIRLFQNIARCMARDGALIIGSTESISGLCPQFKSQRHLRSVFYHFEGAV